MGTLAKFATTDPAGYDAKDGAARAYRLVGMPTIFTSGGFMNRSVRVGAALLVLGLLGSACGSDGDEARPTVTTSDTPSREGLQAQVAGYDFGTDGPQRFIVGLLAGEGKLVSFGTVRFNFVYLGTKEAPQEQGAVGANIEARWIPIPGQSVDPASPGPRVVEPSDGAGVYEATDVRFDQAGFWGVVVTANVDGKQQTAQARFEVRPTSLVPGPGDPAPRTENLLPGAADAPVKAVDSRAEDDGSVPDPELHRQTVAAAIATGRPTLLVVSTPVFCVSRFCGPITDAVQNLAKEYGDRVNFVHIEVWRDYEGKAINRGAAEWIYPAGSQDIYEPWVFLIGGDGVVQRRWDNVAHEPDLRAAVQGAAAG